MLCLGSGYLNIYACLEKLGDSYKNRRIRHNNYGTRGEGMLTSKAGEWIEGLV